MNRCTIAAWDIFRSRWLYWDIETEAFTLLEIQAGELMRVTETPIKLVHNRILGD
jgi:hypothetical protein